jgi:hypothetical protein
VVVRPDAPSYGNVIVEGPMDALAAAGAGFTGYALMGMQPNAATLHHLALLLDDRHTLVLFDRDSMHHAIPVVMFLAANEHSVVRGSIPAPEKDLAECHPEKRRSLFQRYFK